MPLYSVIYKIEDVIIRRFVRLFFSGIEHEDEEALTPETRESIT